MQLRKGIIHAPGHFLCMAFRSVPNSTCYFQTKKEPKKCPKPNLLSLHLTPNKKLPYLQPDDGKDQCSFFWFFHFILNFYTFSSLSSCVRRPCFARCFLRHIAPSEGEREDGLIKILEAFLGVYILRTSKEEWGIQMKYLLVGTLFYS